MTIRVAIEHRTTYRFAHPVTVHPHEIRLRPAPHSRTPIEAYSLRIEPADHFLNWQQDPLGNWVARLVFQGLVTELDITVDLVADMTVINPFDFFVEESAAQYPFAYPEQLGRDLGPYLEPVADPEGALAAWIDAHDLRPGQGPAGERTIDFLVRLNRAAQSAIAYTTRLEVGVQTPTETLNAALGSCRDSAWLLVAALRQLGLASRFVSGYLVQLASDVEAVDGPSGPASDFTDLHAWTEAYVPGAGWVGLDPTSGLLTGEGHIPLCAAPHPSAAAPITGSTDPVAVDFAFSNSVTRIHEDPRVTAPYSDTQWASVGRLGAHVDELLAAGDVRLTMGGEPTFVAVGDTSAPEWETDADGPDKRVRAQELAARLRERWAAGGLVHHGQGKWYPGEPLPRWQIQLLWRPDGRPLWQRPDLLANPWSEPDVEPGSEAATQAARSLAEAVARRFALAPNAVLPAFDDAFADAWDDLRLPDGPPPGADEDVADPRVLDETSRSRARAFVLPLFEDPDDVRWGTTTWRTRRPRLTLTPGTSPAGYRLPLGSIAWTPPPDVMERSAFEPRPDLPDPGPHDSAAPATTTATLRPIEDAPRHALVVEERDGHLFVFLPPVEHLELATELVAIVEDAAAETGLPVVLEGYSLPGDPRIRTLSVTPDPGVIEVNVQPTSTWPELVELTETLYEDARQTHLTSEKFDLDGTHTGTGGGNHFTLGGATPADSPLLRRPDLLRSLITYWQHHPSLSYVFAGRFIGPTSQAPRVDEGRHETLYELEIAFAEMERAVEEGRDSPAWVTDRALRHLLTDLTGNTHRSEFCIDKLHAPGTERGRLGLLEMRGFEMPPHPRMALAQALLVRSLVARFWDEPYAAPLVRWGSRLHDRFLLPGYAMADLHDVVTDLNAWLDRAGPRTPMFDPAWFDPFLEFRFPRLGEVTVAGVHLELRSAIEPWHVLGEEVSQSGTSRFVDSSLERVQVRATGLVEGRHVVTCNGIPLPMARQGAPGSFVAGVRYRAWAPWSALHPTIGVHGPLVVDLVDRWNGRSLGGFTHHVVHPGGRSYDSYPVNAVEAEARRASRFRTMGHTPGPIDPDAWPRLDAATTDPRSEYPCTLDLRRFDPGRRGGPDPTT